MGGALVSARCGGTLRTMACRDTEHAPTRQCLPPGLYEHQCPACGATSRFHVRAASLALTAGLLTGLLSFGACGGRAPVPCATKGGAGPSGPVEKCEVRR